MASSPGNVAARSPLMQGIASLDPAYFSLVMATGIVALATHLLKMPAMLTTALFWIDLSSYVILCLLTIARLVLYPRMLWADLIDHRRGVGFFTTVAATCVLGTQMVLLQQWYSIALALWYLGIVLWAVFVYTVFTSFAVKEVKPSLAEGLHGGWLVSVVAAQSVSLLGTMLSGRFGEHREAVLFFTLCMWLGAGMLYIWIISLIFYRYSFFSLSPADLTPPYWINMGAMAISTLAGAMLVNMASDSPLLQQLLPFVRGLTLLFWATATWWVPMLVLLGVWRHVYRRFRLAYVPAYWGGVFPLGMYAVCTYRLIEMLNIPFLMFLPRSFGYIALVAWSATFLGMILSLARALGPSGKSGHLNHDRIAKV